MLNWSSWKIRYKGFAIGFAVLIAIQLIGFVLALLQPWACEGWGCMMYVGFMLLPAYPYMHFASQDYVIFMVLSYLAYPLVGFLIGYFLEKK